MPTTIWPPGAGRFLTVTLLFLLSHSLAFIALAGVYLDISPKLTGYLIPAVLFPSLIVFLVPNYLVTRGSFKASNFLRILAIAHIAFQLPIYWLASESAYYWMASVAIICNLLAYKIIYSERYQQFINFFKERAKYQSDPKGEKLTRGNKRYAIALLILLFNQSVCFSVITRHYLNIPTETLDTIKTFGLIFNIALIVPLLLWAMRGSLRATNIIRGLYAFYIIVLLPLYWVANDGAGSLIMPSIAVAASLLALALTMTKGYRMQLEKLNADHGRAGR